MSTILIASALSPFSARLRIAIALKGLDIPIEPPPGPAGTAAVKAINPFGQIPILMIDARVLVESLALLDYLEDAYPGTRSLRPSDPIQAARVRAIGLLFDNKVILALAPLFAQMLGAQPPDVAAVHASFDAAAGHLASLATFFDEEGPAIGMQLSTADCALAPFAWLLGIVAPKYGAVSPFERVPRIAQWWQAVSAVAEVNSVTTAMQTALAAFMAAPKK